MTPKILKNKSLGKKYPSFALLYNPERCIITSYAKTVKIYNLTTIL